MMFCPTEDRGGPMAGYRALRYCVSCWVMLRCVRAWLVFHCLAFAYELFLVRVGKSLCLKVPIVSRAFL
jgi:hypothetical protein